MALVVGLGCSPTQEVEPATPAPQTTSLRDRQAPLASSPKPAQKPPKKAELEFVTIEGIEVPKGSKKITVSWAFKGTIAIQISEDITYQGIPVSKGRALFYKSTKRLAHLTLSENLDIRFKIGEKEYSTPAAGGKNISLYENGIPMFVRTYKKFEFNGDTFPPGSLLRLWGTGNLRGGKPVPGTIIQGFPIGPVSYPFHYIAVDADKTDREYKNHANGVLWAFALGEDHTIQKIDFLKNTSIYLDEKRRLQKVIIYETHTIFGKKYEVHGIDSDKFDKKTGGKIVAIEIIFNQWGYPIKSTPISLQGALRGVEALRELAPAPGR